MIVVSSRIEVEYRKLVNATFGFEHGRNQDSNLGGGGELKTKKKL